MWISFFTVALVIAIGLGTASLFIEANTKAPRRLVRRRVFRSRGGFSSVASERRLEKSGQNGRSFLLRAANGTLQYCGACRLH
jgi:hypothetical protein